MRRGLDVCTRKETFREGRGRRERCKAQMRLHKKQRSQVQNWLARPSGARAIDIGMFNTTPTNNHHGFYSSSRQYKHTRKPHPILSLYTTSKMVSYTKFTPSPSTPLTHPKQTRDSSATYLHMHHSHHADLLESFTNPTSSELSPEDIYIPPQHQPVNPEDEDDVVPDQHAAFGIQRATQSRKEPQWRDLGLEELLRRGPGEIGRSGGAGGGGGNGAGRGGNAREEPVLLALRRQPGARAAPVRSSGGEVQSQGGGAGNGLPR